MSIFSKLKNNIKEAFKSNKIDDAFFESLEDMLIEADFGPVLASQFIDQVRSKKLKTEDDVIDSLKESVIGILNPVKSELKINKVPYVFMVVGVNGSGKTTSIAKMIYKIKHMGYSVDVAACDTFRESATEQLEYWANKIGSRLFKASEDHKDPASVAYEAVTKSESDVLIVDTAGRLHNNSNLMQELAKIKRVIGKVRHGAPDETVIVLDATIGQNSIEQINGFQDAVHLDSIILSKMDGMSKGGSIVNIASQFRLPIIAVGTGERETDLESFNADLFWSKLSN